MAMAPSGAGESIMTMCLKRGLRAHGLKLVELLARGDDGNAAIGVANLLGDLLAGERGIERHIGRADGQRGEIGDGPLPAILADESDAVAFFRAEAEQCGGQSADALIDLVGRERMPLAELVLPQNGARIGGRGDANEEVVDRGDRKKESLCWLWERGQS